MIPIIECLYKQNLLSPESRSPVPVRLKRNGTLSLGGITTIFTESITEEHAWAVVYGCALALEGLLKGGGDGEEELSLFLVQSRITSDPCRRKSASLHFPGEGTRECKSGTHVNLTSSVLDIN
ncbi:Spire, partial [Caligus rogercresseyi]